mgnify:CR=1 FL=1
MLDVGNSTDFIIVLSMKDVEDTIEFGGQTKLLERYFGFIGEFQMAANSIVDLGLKVSMVNSKVNSKV